MDKPSIPPNLRLLHVMEEIALAGVPVAPSVLSDRLGLPKATIHRLLHLAEDEGILQRDVDGRSYGPGRRMRRLASHTLSSQRVRSERLRVMRDLARQVGETCNLAAPGREGMVYLDRVETHWPLRIQLPVGTQVPFHCTASGKMYLSSLGANQLRRLLGSLDLAPRTAHSHTSAEALRRDVEAIRQRGYATDDQEFMDGMAALAVPILDDRQRLLTTLSLHAPIQRHGLQDLHAFLTPLKTAAAQLEQLALEE